MADGYDIVGEHLGQQQLLRDGKRELWLDFRVVNAVPATLPAGLTWQDGYTQHVMARELAGLPQASPRRPEASSPAR